MQASDLSHLRSLILDASQGAAADERERLIALVSAEIDRAIGAERERCAALCRERAALWRRTTAASSTLAAAREEARARANEAAYLADLIAVGGDTHVPPL